MNPGEILVDADRTAFRDGAGDEILEVTILYRNLPSGYGHRLTSPGA